MKRILRAVFGVLKYCFAFLVGCIIGLAISGGGFGRKDPLPPHLMPIMKFAHRGGGTPAIPENTLASVASMQGKGFTGVEIDIQKTKDGQFILFHDQETNRLLGIRGNASDMTLAELRKGNIAYQDFSMRPSREKVALLKDVITPYKKKYVFYFDMKGYGSKGPFDLADEIARFIESEKCEDHVLVASSNFLFTAYMEFRHPQIYTVMEGFDPSMRTLFALIPLHLKPDFIAGPEEDFTPEFAEWLKSSGYMDRFILFDLNALTLKRVQTLGLKNFMADYSKALDPFLKN